MVKYFRSTEAEEIGKQRVIEERQFKHGYFDAKFFNKEKFEKSSDCVSIWIGKTDKGRYYIGIAGRTVPPNHHGGCWFFETAGFQEITEEVYNELLKADVWEETR